MCTAILVLFFILLLNAAAVCLRVCASLTADCERLGASDPIRYATAFE